MDGCGVGVGHDGGGEGGGGGRCDGGGARSMDPFLEVAGFTRWWFRDMLHEGPALSWLFWLLDDKRWEWFRGKRTDRLRGVQAPAVAVAVVVVVVVADALAAPATAAGGGREATSLSKSSKEALEVASLERLESVLLRLEELVDTRFWTKYWMVLTLLQSYFSWEMIHDRSVDLPADGIGSIMSKVPGKKTPKFEEISSLGGRSTTTVSRMVSRMVVVVVVVVVAVVAADNRGRTRWELPLWMDDDADAAVG